jgi:hypothetical protein
MRRVAPQPKANRGDISNEFNPGTFLKSFDRPTFGSSGIRKIKITTYLPCQIIVYLAVSGDSRGLAHRSVDVDAVLAALAEKLATMLFQVTDKFLAFHAEILSGSRITF